MPSPDQSPKQFIKLKETVESYARQVDIDHDGLSLQQLVDKACEEASGLDGLSEIVSEIKSTADTLNLNEYNPKQSHSYQSLTTLFKRAAEWQYYDSPLEIMTLPSRALDEKINKLAEHLEIFHRVDPDDVLNSCITRICDEVYSNGGKIYNSLPVDGSLRRLFDQLFDLNRENNIRHDSTESKLAEEYISAILHEYDRNPPPTVQASRQDSQLIMLMADLAEAIDHYGTDETLRGLETVSSFLKLTAEYSKVLKNSEYNILSRATQEVTELFRVIKANNPQDVDLSAKYSITQQLSQSLIDAREVAVKISSKPF